MKILKTLFAVAIFSVSTVALSEVAVVVHPTVSESISQDDVKKIFLGKSKSLPSGHKVIPISLKQGSAARDEFNEKILSKSDSQLKAYWSKLIFTGKGQPPKELDSDVDIMNMIKNNPNLIGYIDAGSVDSSVSVLATY